jgi:hypothetical protein
MNNVIQLFDRKNVVSVPSKSERGATAEAKVFASSARLDIAIKSVSKLFDAVEIAIDSIDDPESRSRLRRSTKMNRTTLSNAALKLSQYVGALRASIEKAGKH